MIHHPFDPVYDQNSKILILGSFPSVKSREDSFYYGHPRNRFWMVLAAIFGEDVPLTNREKKDFLLRNHVALWDVIASCEVTGSADSSIKNVVPNDIPQILNYADIKAVFLNGKTSEKYYNRCLRDAVDVPAFCLPSTSPANASWTLAELIDAWRVIRLDCSMQGENN